MDLSIKLAGIPLKNPVMVASGTFGFGEEYKNYYDIQKLGAMMTKGLTLKPKQGNPPPRLWETPSGILNSIGLENPGIEVFAQEIMPKLRELDLPIIANINGETTCDYKNIAKILTKIPDIAALEVNISCPNVEKGGMAFGQDPEVAYNVVRCVREETQLPIIVKLSPNVTHIKDIAKAVVTAGADAISLINTILGMAIDINQKKPVFSRTFAGLSGPAVKPIALRMVWEVYETVDVPIIAMGGISTPEDAIEFILAGASAIAVGTANFVDPQAPLKIIEGIEEYLKREEMSLKDLIGFAHKN